MTIQILSAKIQEQVTEEAPQPSKAEIENYYEAAKSSQYTTGETREIRLIKNKDKAKVEEAKKLLEKDDSAKSWAKSPRSTRLTRPKAAVACRPA